MVCVCVCVNICDECRGDCVCWGRGVSDDGIDACVPLWERERRVVVCERWSACGCVRVGGHVCKWAFMNKSLEGEDTRMF